MASLSLHLESLDDPEPWVVEQKVFDVLSEYLQPSSTTTSAVAAQGIDALTPMKRSDLGDDKEKEEPESFMWEIWGIFIAIAKQIPHDHPSQDCLVELIAALRDLPPSTVEIWDSETRIWTDLPILGPAMREAWISPASNDAYSDLKTTAEWINQNSFAARLLNHGSVSWTNLAIWGLRSALETELTGSQLVCNAAAAAEWVAHSGEVLYQELGEETEDKEDSAIASGALYKGKGALSRDRWQFWKQRFGDISKQETGTVQTVAQDARKKMEAIEQKGA